MAIKDWKKIGKNKFKNIRKDLSFNEKLYSIIWRNIKFTKNLNKNGKKKI